MKEYLSLIILYGVIQATTSQNPCILKNAADITNNNPAGLVCVCNSTYCDDLPQLNNLQNNKVAIYRSSLSGQRFHTEQFDLTTDSANSNDIVITIDSSIKYQQIHGFGGAFTGTASYNIMKLANGSRINLMNSYFGQTGNGYTTCRVTLAASDFSIKGYSYDDCPGVSQNCTDFNLTYFKLDELEDIAYKIPAIQLAQSFAGNNLKLFGSPWSPPAWMKNNTNISGQSDAVIRGSFAGNDSAYWNTYANYFYRFFEEHAKYNITFWGVTIQNEPYNGMTPGMILVPEKERDFIKYFLGPKLRKNALTKDLKIMIWDFNRNNAENYTDTVLADQTAASFVDGIAIHWYDDVQFKINYTVPEHIHAKHPDKWIMNTEACAGWMGQPNDIKGVTLGNWSRGELYAHDILDNLNHWSTGWVDWNMVLNMTGGPLWQANPVDAPIIVADDNVTFYKQPMFYVLGHFSKFVISGSYRIDSKWSSTSDKLEGATFITPTNQIVVVLHNRDPSQNYSITINDVQNPCQNAKLTIESKSIVTLIWNKDIDCSSNVQSSTSNMQTSTSNVQPSTPKPSSSNSGFSLMIEANHSVYVVLLIVFFVFRNF